MRRALSTLLVWAQSVWVQVLDGLPLLRRELPDMRTAKRLTAQRFDQLGITRIWSASHMFPLGLRRLRYAIRLKP